MFSLALLGLLLSCDYDIKLVGVHGLPHVVIRPGTVALSDQPALRSNATVPLKLATTRKRARNPG
jgi:hypothetical protein